MKNGDSIKRRLEEVKEMDDYKNALSALADIQYDIGISACVERSELRKELEALRRVISGNGHPTDSVLARLSGVEKSIKVIGNDITDIKRALLGDLRDGEQTKGVVERIRDCEKANANIQKFIWIIISLVAGQVIMSLMGLL